MNPFQVSANDVQAFECELGDDCPAIAWGTPPQNYKIVPGSVEQNRPLREGGFSHAYDFQCLARVSQFINQNIPDVETLSRKLTSPPQPFQYLNGKYKVFAVHILSGGTMIRILGNSLNQNA